ncbi:MAG: 5'-nucleotidase C-terminal domain-containing protein [Gemmatimonadota bacterium]|nr:MAG: 5'-nucleotidase C-terminal domain-containing protein [Gemmatimonadota bacterium]
MTSLPQRTALAVLAAAVTAATAQAQDTAHVVVVASTDVHGQVFHWDYVRDTVASWGLTRAATVVDSLRRAYPEQVVVLDAGDLIQGSPFATYFARENPVAPHPVVDALNALRYDAATPGNHEFNFGLDVYGRAAESAAYPIVAGNVYRLPRDELVYPGYVVLQRGGVQVAVAGFTTPGSMVWDRHHLEGRLRIRPILPEAERVLGQIQAEGADLRIVLMHSGMSGASSYDTTGVGPENVAAALAGLPVVPHLVIVGHSHGTIADSVIAGVHYVQPRAWARSLSVAHVWLERQGAHYEVVRIRGEQIDLGTVPPDPVVTRRLEARHHDVRAWVALPLGRAEGNWSARYARAEDTPIVDFVNEVQRSSAGTQLSSTAAFNPWGALGPGEVRLRDVAGIYPYENTLRAVRIDGASLQAYLERTTIYFNTYRPGEPIINDSVPGYHFDMVSGIEYVIDLSQPVGRRIRQLTYQGRPVQPADTLTLALNNYRQGGGGGFEMLVDLPLIYDYDQNVRDLIAEYVRRVGVLRDTTYFTPSWRIVPPEAAAAVRAAFAPREESPE